VDRKSNAIHVSSFDFDGNGRWNILHQHQDQIYNVGPVSISSDGIVHFKATFSRSKGSLNLTASILRIGQLQIDSISPDKFFADEKEVCID
jgi:hypothetical protein